MNIGGLLIDYMVCNNCIFNNSLIIGLFRVFQEKHRFKLYGNNVNENL